VKHKCLDCERNGIVSERFVSRKEATRAARAKCYTCGSPRLEPVSKKKSNEQEPENPQE
jgi:hypothetical protein